MKTLKRLLPVLGITGITLIISFLLYMEIMEREEKRCWQELSSTAQDVSSEIKTKFQDEITKLHLMEKIILQSEQFGTEDIGLLHIETVQPTTIFRRIDVLYPDNTLISNGSSIVIEEEVAFEEIKEKGEYLTQRMADFETEKECVYYVLPVMKNEEVIAVLIGMIDAGSLSEVFQPIIYNGQASICIIDSKDGSYIMDSWHDELGNAYDKKMTERKKIKGYEDVDMKESLKKLETGRVAFESRTTGKPLYMYYMPIGMFDWQLAIFAAEDVLFENLRSLQRIFILAGIAESVLLVLYYIWNIRMVRMLEQDKTELEKQREWFKQMGYKDMLTSMYNRNKYMEIWRAFKARELRKVGVAYIDLNGLKQINDLHSHDAGDEYICNAAKAISEVFEENCYRIGGDEFVILLADIEYDEFAAEIVRLQEIMKQKDISISIGFLWEEFADNLDALLKKAEQEMYREKEKYYTTHDRRR